MTNLGRSIVPEEEVARRMRGLEVEEGEGERTTEAGVGVGVGSFQVLLLLALLEAEARVRFESEIGRGTLCNLTKYFHQLHFLDTRNIESDEKGGVGGREGRTVQTARIATKVLVRVFPPHGRTSGTTIEALWWYQTRRRQCRCARRGSSSRSNRLSELISPILLKDS